LGGKASKRKGLRRLVAEVLGFNGFCLDAHFPAADRFECEQPSRIKLALANYQKLSLCQELSTCKHLGKYFVPVFCVCDSYHSYPKTHSSPWILSLDIDIMLSPVKCLFRSALLCLRDTFLNPKTYSLSMAFIAKVRLYAFSY